MNNLTVYTAAGPIKIVTAQEFIRMIPLETVSRNNVHVPKIDMTYHPVSFEDTLVGPISSVISERVDLNKSITIDIIHFRFNNNRSDYEELKYNYMFRLIHEELFTIVAKKDVSYHQKDLSMKAIEDLSNKYLRHGGSADLVGVLFNLSEYQKFFLLTSPEYFKGFFTNEVQMADRDAIRIMGALADLRPENWFSGRYDELTLMKEMASQMRYMVPMGTDVGKMDNVVGGLMYTPSMNGVITNLTYD